MNALQVVYGVHPVRALLLRHPARVRSLHLLERRDDPRVQELEALARRHGTPIQRLDAAGLKMLAGEAVHQGVVAQIEPLAPWSEDDLLEALQKAQRPLILALDGVQDPHNLGACLRTADACGVLAVIVPRDRAAQLTPAARKVAAGGAESTPVVPVTNLVRTLKLLKQAGLWVTGADATASDARLPREVDFTDSSVLVMGAEGAGLRHLTRQSCDWLVRLPQLGSVESLNVSVATGMLLYEALRQRTAR